MTINGEKTNATHFAYEGCHKIYLLEGNGDKANCLDMGYDILPISELQQTFENSCSLRFISDWRLSKHYVSQFEEAHFGE
jgi:hypothetical protein